MNDEQLRHFAEEYAKFLEDQATGRVELGGGLVRQTVGEAPIGLPSPDAIFRHLKKLKALGRAVGAESVSISGGFGLTFGVSCPLTDPDEPTA